jgi:hypothetical protein
MNPTASGLGGGLGESDRLGKSTGGSEGGQPARILLIEDDFTTQRMIASYLEERSSRALRPSIFDDHIPALDIAPFLEASLICSDKMLHDRGSRCLEIQSQASLVTARALRAAMSPQHCQPTQ